MLIVGQIIRAVFGILAILIGLLISFATVFASEFEAESMVVLLIFLPLTIWGCWICFASVRNIIRYATRDENNVSSETTDGSTENNQLDAARSASVSAVKWTVFFVVWFGGGYLLDVRLGGVWDSSSGSPVPSHFTILVYNETTDRLDQVGFESLDDYLSRTAQRSEKTSLLLPEDASDKYAFSDSDFQFVVETNNSAKQKINFSYQLGLLNHASSKWYATRDDVAPISATSTTGAYLMSFLIGIGLILFWEVVRILINLMAGIRSGTDRL